MKLDRSRSFGRVKSMDPKHKVCFTQDGIDYGPDDEALNQKQVKKYLDDQAATIQDEADAAMSLAKTVQAEAANRLAELKELKANK